MTISPRSTIRYTTSALTAALLLVWSLDSLAQSRTQTVSVSYVSSSLPGCSATTSDAPDPSTVGCSFSEYQHAGGGAAFAGASFGHAGVIVSASGAEESAQPDPFYNFSGANVSASASFYDTIVISNLAPNEGPTSGVLHFSIYLQAAQSGLMVTRQMRDATSASVAGSYLLADISAGGGLFSRGYFQEDIGLYQFMDGTSYNSTSASSSWDGETVSSIFGYREFATSFQFGIPFNIGLNLQIGAYAQALGTASATIGLDASRSLDWAGIQGVSVDGVDVPFTITSLSGTDYTKSFVPLAPVPEPQAWMLMSLGLAALPFASRGIHLRRTARSNTAI